MMTFTLSPADLAVGDFVPEFSGHIVSIKESRRPGTGELGGFLVDVAELVGGNTNWLLPTDHMVTAVLSGGDTR